MDRGEASPLFDSPDPQLDATAVYVCLTPVGKP